MKRTLSFKSMNGFTEVVLIDKIVRLSKSVDLGDNGEYPTLIILTDGTHVTTTDSIRTLDARLNSKES